jgi:2-dehydro-3-deoxygalactonokinase
MTIDVGTTNTRIRFIEGQHIVGQYKDHTGVRDTAITGSLDKLKQALQSGIFTCLKLCDKSLEDVEKIIASGMITSNLGLLEISHLETPVGIEDLGKGIRMETFHDIVNQPMYFIPGVKNRVNIESVDYFDEIDMMRGEEVEALGTLHLLGVAGKALFISPGSHTKFVFINDEQKIERCSTTLMGELLWALSRETILANSIPENLVTSIDEAYVRKGIAAAEKHGFSKACFLVRIMDLFTDASPNQRANFMAGALGYYDIGSVKDYLLEEKPKIFIGGTVILRDLYWEILKILDYDMTRVERIEQDILEKSSAIGAIVALHELEKYNHLNDPIKV